MHAYDRYLTALAGRGRVQFAVKARPEPQLLEALVRRGAGLDVASTNEIRAALAAECPPELLSHSNVFRHEREIAESFDLGVRVFCADSAAELTRLRRAAPGASVMLRLTCAPAGSELPRFGCHATEAVALAQLADEIGLHVAGLTWHVGTQQTDPAQWRTAIEQAAAVWSAIRRAGIDGLRVLNVGGGVPARYRRDVPTVETCTATILAAVDDHFGPAEVDVVVEPGRSLVAEAGITVARVKSVLERGGGVAVVLDAGIWNAGLVECLLSGVEYPVHALDHPANAPDRPVRLCGPTCDPLDELRVATPYRLPVALAPGDRVLIGSTGAYCASTTATDFCGYPPLPNHVLPARAMEVSR
ncbi:hypothetical protein ACFVVM_08100 [Nocardia sp. NPDC058176]|uniref:hypothetical protein n=1 Tax=Nocardia sp. NPDC058176 TaxID=3346368 RepID=UPI0036DD7B22